ncbi:MAG: toprim domain-containing protein [Hydrogenobacter sp.]
MEKALEDFLKDLRSASQTRAVLVEGRRDKQALERFGIKNVLTLGGKRFTDLPDLLEGFSEVILLFDLDKQGEKINRKVKDILSTQGYILIEDFRDKMRELDILFVEELYEKVRGAHRGPGAG